jgi:hypothetical protein
LAIPLISSHIDSARVRRLIRLIPWSSFSQLKRAYVTGIALYHVIQVHALIDG